MSEQFGKTPSRMQQHLAGILISLVILFVACQSGAEVLGRSPVSQPPKVLAFVTTANGKSLLKLTRADGSGLVTLTPPMEVIMGPVFSPDGQQVAFMACEEGSGGECSSGMDIFIVRADGTGLTNITNDTALDSEPSWSPDGNRLAFISERSGNSEIFVANRDGSGAIQLTHTVAYEGFPQWSPDGRKIAFHRTSNFTSEIWSSNADGTGAVRLATQGVRPRWSPDGTLIAFSCSADSYIGICVVQADGTLFRKLSGGLADEFNSAWSPDSTRVVYVTNRDSNPEVYMRYVADTASPTPINLTLDLASDQHPVWSPDGSKIAYSSDGFLSVMNADGSGKVKLPLAIQGPPAWQP